MVAAFGREATAETTSAAPRLRELVAVSSEIVRIGDLVENAGVAADVPVFRAPDLGQTGAVQLPRIIEALPPGAVDSISIGKPTLEDVFVQLTGHRFRDESAR
jgi:flagella basal body P-ring formation protein FlgA